MSFRTISIAVLSALLALSAGMWLGGHPENLPGPLRDAFVEDDRALRAETIDTIGDNFYKPVEEEQLREASLKGMVRSLRDPFSHYLTPKEARRFNESVSGQFEGVGMSVDKDRRGLRVLNVFAGSPAKRGGIRKGDLIVKVNGSPVADLSSEAATARIKGPSGTRVRLGVRTPGRRERTVRLTRARIEVPVARSRVTERRGRKLAVVQLLTFSNGAHGLLRRHIERSLRKGAKGIVLDLRGNGGGLLTEAVLVSSAFIEDGEIVSVKGRARPSRTENAQGDAVAAKVPVVVLVDGGSASASEIVAGALRDRRRVPVVGTRTFGKAVVQESKTLSNDGALVLTVANYYLPSGKMIGTRGLRPDVRARDRPRTRRDEALPVALDELAERSAR
jgi:carboxyl-terminal processing protease